MNITSAKYYKEIPGGTKSIGVLATIDSEALVVPLDPANYHYAALLEWVKEDGNTIEEAD